MENKAERPGFRWVIYYPPGEGNRERATMLLSQCGIMPLLPGNVRKELEKLGPEWRAEKL